MIRHSCSSSKWTYFLSPSLAKNNNKKISSIKIKDYRLFKALARNTMLAFHLDQKHLPYYYEMIYGPSLPDSNALIRLQGQKQFHLINSIDAVNSKKWESFAWKISSLISCLKGFFSLAQIYKHSAQQQRDQRNFHHIYWFLIIS